MGNFKDLVHKLPEEKEVMEELTTLTDNLIETIKITHPQKYTNFIETITKLCMANHFTEGDLIESRQYVPEQYNLDDTTKYVTEKFEIDFAKECFNEYDLNFIMNEMYKLYNNIYNDDTSKYAELTISWLDHHGSKVLKYFNAIYKN